MKTISQPKTQSLLGTIAVRLPGSDRKRTPAEYRFRVTYRNAQAREPGCVMTWAVTGGREEYQISLEQEDRGGNRWHCSCADSIFRGEDDPAYTCKHTKGLIAALQSFQVPSVVV